MFCSIFCSSIYIMTLLSVSGYHAPKKIPSPKHLNDRIAVIGAGPSGVHMAYLLKQKGFKNVKIYEQSSRIGGKSHTVNDNGIPRDMGTVYLNPYTYAGKLAKTFLPNEIVQSSIDVDAWTDASPPAISYHNYILSAAMKTYGSKNKTFVKTMLWIDFSRYEKLRKSLLGSTYKGMLPPEPNSTVMRQLRGSFKDFLTRNNLQALNSFYYFETVLGYGRTDELPALYALLMNGLDKRFFFGGWKRYEDPLLLKRGMQSLWEEIADKEELDIVLNMEVIHMSRLDNQNGNNIRITFKNKLTTNRRHTKTFDFLIWSPEMKASLPLWRNAKQEERDIFSLSEAAHYTTSLVTCKNAPTKENYLTAWYDNMVTRKSDFWLALDTSKVYCRNGGKLHGRWKKYCESNHHAESTMVTYQMSETRTESDILANNIMHELRNAGATNTKIKKMLRWSYFPRYPQHEIEKGILWKILKMQGKYNMWYIGSSVSCEYIDAVLEYNNLLVKNMVIPSR